MTQPYRTYNWLCMTPTTSGPGSYRIELTRMPSRWHRFWVRLILGFHYATTRT